MVTVKIRGDFIKLDQLLKLEGMADNGGMAKEMILDGVVFVNGEVELRRGKKLRPGDEVEVLGNKFIME